MNETTSHRLLLTDRIILFLLIPAIYFEGNLPYFGSASTPFMFFAFTLGYLGITRMQAVLRMIAGKYFLASLFFVFVCIFMETIHTSSQYEDIARYFNMSIGIFCIALLCRDKEAVNVTIFSFIVSSAIQSVILIVGTLTFLRGFSAKGFMESSQIRIQAFDKFFIHSHPIDISLFCAIGALLGIISFFYEPNRLRKLILAILIVPSVVGTFLPASRTGTIIFFVALLIFIYKSKIKVRRWLLPSMIVVILLIFAVPEVVWARLLSFVNFSELQEEDSRTKVYAAVLRSIDQYFLIGIGEGNYWNGWAVSVGISSIRATSAAIVAHNAYFELWMYWGLPALLAFLSMLYIYSKALHKDIANNKYKACIYIFVAAIPMILLIYPAFYNKTFSVGIGMLIGARFWDIYADEEEELPVTDLKELA